MIRLTKRQCVNPEAEVKDDLEVKDQAWYGDRCEALVDQLEAYPAHCLPEDMGHDMSYKERWEHLTEVLRRLRMTTMFKFIKMECIPLWHHIFSFIGTYEEPYLLDQEMIRLGLVCKAARRTVHHLRAYTIDERVLACVTFVRRVEAAGLMCDWAWVAARCNVPRDILRSAYLVQYLENTPGAMEQVELAREHWELLVTSNAWPACYLSDIPCRNDHLEDHEHKRYDAIVNKWKESYIETALTRFTLTNPSKEQLWRELFPDAARSLRLCYTESWKAELAARKLDMDTGLGIAK